MVEVNNPYIEECRKLMLEAEANPTEENKKRYFEVQEKSRAWTQSKLVELSDKTQIVAEKKIEIATKSNYPKITKQYKMACDNYKELMRLVSESRELKKTIRDEISLRRKKDEKTE